MRPTSPSTLKICSVIERYPWHAALWETAMRWKQRLPNALLLEGPPGVGKVHFAERWAQALMCASPSATGDACGTCRDCLWLSSGTHPDFRCVTVETQNAEEGEGTAKRRPTEITVSQIRSVIASLQLTPHSAARRIVLIHPAEAMNKQAANALLKVLEEPGDDIIFILVTHRSASLLPTVRSRCQRLILGLPAAALAQSWLNARGVPNPAVALSVAGGAPLAAACSTDLTALRSQSLRALAEPQKLDYILLAELCAGRHTEAMVWLQKWIYDILCSRMADGIRFNIDFTKEINALQQHINIHALGRYYRDLTRAIRMADHPLNAQLVLETLFMQYRQIMTHSDEAANV